MLAKAPIVLMVILAAVGCAPETGTEAQAQPQAEAEAEAEVGLTSAALFDETCDGRTPSLREFAQSVTWSISGARTMYEADHHNELALRYFGEWHNEEFVSATLLRMVERGRSSNLHFECHDDTVDPNCADPSRLFYLPNSLVWLESEWTLHVCGTRFWDVVHGTGSNAGQDSVDGASMDGIMVHELAHVSGAVSDRFTMQEAALINHVKDETSSQNSFQLAEAFRHYVMH